MNADSLFACYCDLQEYVGWTPADAENIARLRPLLTAHLGDLIDDFYRQIQTRPHLRRLIRGGDEQIQRLKSTLTQWLTEMLNGPYDAAYVQRRWLVGRRHVEIGLEHTYAIAALARLRQGLCHVVHEEATTHDGGKSLLSLHRLIDLDAAIIERAYQLEHSVQLQRRERELAQVRERELDRARMHSELALGTLLQTAPCLIVIVRLDYRIVFLSPFGETITGYSQLESFGKEFLEHLIPDGRRGEMLTNLQRSLRTDSFGAFEGPIRCKDGSTRWLLWNAKPLVDFEGAPASLVVGHDIHALKKAREQAVQSERLAAIGQMMTVLAHESGNALGRAQANLELLADEVAPRPEIRDMITRIQAAMSDLKQLYTEIRNFAAPIQLELDHVDVLHVWRRAWNHLVESKQASHASLVEHVEGVEMHAEVDAFRLEQVFRNIFENSIAAGGPSTRIDITCRDGDIVGQRALMISVLDDGPGLNEEQSRRIFEPFFTTKSRGTGLGMAVAKRIMDAHGGAIDVGPNNSPGAEVILILPRVGSQ